MSDFRAVSRDEMPDKLRAAVSPLIVIHVRPDGDAVGSAVALYHLFAMLGKQATVLCSDPLPRRLTFMWQGVPHDFTPDGKPHTVICVDVAAPEQIGSLASMLQGDLAVSLMIDHHDRNTVFADHFILPSAAASGEIIWELTQEMRRKGMIDTPPRALIDAVYAAMSSDTGCFRYSNVTSETMRCAAELLDAGADAAELNRLLFDCKTEKQLKAESMVGDRVTLYCGGKIGAASVEYEEMTTDGYSTEDFETAIDIVRSIDGVEIAIVTKGTADGKTKCSLRSCGANVADLAAVFGGGGHVRAAGCSIDEPPKQAVLTLVREAEKLLV